MKYLLQDSHAKFPPVCAVLNLLDNGRQLKHSSGDVRWLSIPDGVSRKLLIADQIAELFPTVSLNFQFFEKSAY